MRLFVALAAVAASAVPASAHIQLDVPFVRYSNSPSEVNKRCPCGAGGRTPEC